ncbi:hypothetical protein [Streptomyces flavalbus]|uniref:Uncharacterized protein n=1 Tax=Streptomyces flavalbus TaxID=2665155 RepID=A0ABW2WF38_9ACTN
MTTVVPEGVPTRVVLVAVRPGERLRVVPVDARGATAPTRSLDLYPGVR